MRSRSSSMAASLSPRPATNYGPRNPGMPESAISSGVIDLAVPVEQMGRADHGLRPSHRSLAPRSWKKTKRTAGRCARPGPKFIDLLRSRCGHDFSGYKIKTFMATRDTPHEGAATPISVRDYIGMLEREPEEVKNLLTDLLINVTHFFRAPPSARLRGAGAGGDPEAVRGPGPR